MNICTSKLFCILWIIWNYLFTTKLFHSMIHIYNHQKHSLRKTITRYTTSQMIMKSSLSEHLQSRLRQGEKKEGYYFSFSWENYIWWMKYWMCYFNNSISCRSFKKHKCKRSIDFFNLEAKYSLNYVQKILF